MNSNDQNIYAGKKKNNNIKVDNIKVDKPKKVVYSKVNFK
jgi:hypothetical protein